MLAYAPSVGYIHEPFNPLTDPGTGGSFDHFLAYVTDETAGHHEESLRRCLSFRYDWGRQLPRIHDPKTAARTLRDAWKWSRLRTKSARPLVKDPIAVFSAPWLADTFDMEVVVTVRRPQAFVASFKKLGWSHDFARTLADERLMTERLAPFSDEIARQAVRGGTVVEQATLLWRMVHQTIDDYRLERPEWTIARQEDLSLDPVGGFSQLYRSLDLELTPEAEGAIRSHSSAANPARLAKAHDTRLDSAASLRSWQAVLTDAETAWVEQETSALTARLYPDFDVNP